MIVGINIKPDPFVFVGWIWFSSVCSLPHLAVLGCSSGEDKIL